MLKRWLGLPASTPDKVQVRLATRADLPALEWDGEYTHFRRLYREIFESTQQGRSLMWVADLPGRGVIGQLFLQITSNREELADGHSRGYIYGFRIRPEFRNQGIGSKMMRVAEDYLLKRRFRWVTLNVACDNPDARRLYERLGYRVVASDPGRWSYLDDQGLRREVIEPAWRLEKDLTQVNKS